MPPPDHDGSLFGATGRRERGVMRVSLAPRRRPNALEQLVGRRRARALRRRLGWFALGAGVVLLRPRVRWARLAMSAALGLAVLVAVGLRAG